MPVSKRKSKENIQGLEGSYMKAFAEIMNMNLFGIESFDGLEPLLIVSMYSQKVPIQQILISMLKSGIIEEIKNLESWDDVINMTNRL